MPNYDLRCKKCGHVFNKNLSFSERKEAACDACGSKQLEQVYKCCNTLGVKGGATKSSCAKQGGCGSCTGCH